MSGGGRFLVQMWATASMIWLATIPLAAWHFQLLAPIGTLLNVVLVPYTALVLWPGFLFLGVGMLLPAIAGLLAWCFDRLLGGLLFVTEWGASVEHGHFFAPAPSMWWLIGFYVLLTGAFRWIPSLAVTRWSRRLILMWIAIGLLPNAPDRGEGELRVSFLPVGHGGCVLVECPSGRVVIYDCGSFGDGDRAADILLATLSSRDIQRIDALFVSHADSDHYNGIEPLVERIPIGTVFMPRGFLDFEQSMVESTCNALARTETSIKILSAGDRPRIDPDVACEVLHPADGFADELDNAESLVVFLEYADRRILLMGDLEGSGFAELSAQFAAAPIDILQSPHHGSPAANTADLRDWANPKWMVVCSGPDDDLARLSATFTKTEVLSTAFSGTVTFTINTSGEVDMFEHIPTLAAID